MRSDNNCNALLGCTFKVQCSKEFSVGLTTWNVEYGNATEISGHVSVKITKADLV